MCLFSNELHYVDDMMAVAGYPMWVPPVQAVVEAGNRTQDTRDRSHVVVDKEVSISIQSACTLQNDGLCDIKEEWMNGVLGHESALLS